MWGLRRLAVILVCECVFPQIVQILSEVPEALASAVFHRGSKTSVPGAASRPQIKNCVRKVCCVQSKSGDTRSYTVDFQPYWEVSWLAHGRSLW